MQIPFQKEKRYPEKNIYKNSRTAKENRQTWLLCRENQGDGKTYEKTSVYSGTGAAFFINHGGLRSEWNENGRAGDIEKSRRERGDVPPGKARVVLFYHDVHLRGLPEAAS